MTDADIQCRVTVGNTAVDQAGDRDGLLGRKAGEQIKIKLVQVGIPRGAINARGCRVQEQGYVHIRQQTVKPVQGGIIQGHTQIGTHVGRHESQIRHRTGQFLAGSTHILYGYGREPRHPVRVLGHKVCESIVVGATELNGQI